MKILFIAWDGPQSSYMEGLFMPIFNAIHKKEREIEFHILQFTWNNSVRIQKIKAVAEDKGFVYHSFKVSRKPNAAIGGLITVFRGARVILRYVKKNDIDVIMPRSTMPGIMVNLILSKLSHIKVVFDADGLPLEERIEGGSLKRDSKLYNILRYQEKRTISKADAVLVRAEYAIEYHKKSDDNLNISKFFKVINGRSMDSYRFDPHFRGIIRQDLNLNNDSFLIIYVGSLGDKYGIKEMVLLYEKIKAYKEDTVFLILTPSTDYLFSTVEKNVLNKIIVKSVSFDIVNQYLSAADLAFCLINQSLSMRAATATKLGEYFMAGLPVIATSRIGDNDNYIKGNNFCFLLDNYSDAELEKAALWAVSLGVVEREKIETYGQKYFSLDTSALTYLKAIESV